jgi:hypothetical protein
VAEHCPSSTNRPSPSTQRFSGGLVSLVQEERSAETARSKPSRMDAALRTMAGDHGLGSLSTAMEANASNDSDLGWSQF